MGVARDRYINVAPDKNQVESSMEGAHRALDNGYSGRRLLRREECSTLKQMLIRS